MSPSFLTTLARKMLPLMMAGVPQVLSANFPPIPADLSTPVQQRLAVKAPSSVSVGWNTYEQLNGTYCVAYGTSNDSLPLQACGQDSKTYPTSRTWGNEVTLTGLQPATTYYYKIPSTNSSVDYFFSPRTAGDTTAFNMDIVIDLGVYGADGYTTSNKRDVPQIQPELNHTTIGALARTVADYELVIHPGDFAYADDWYVHLPNLLDGEAAYQSILEQFYQQLAPVAGRKLYMVSPGNHEADCTEIPFTARLCPQGQYNFSDFNFRFGDTMPTAFTSSSSNSAAQANAAKAQQLALPPFWYSFKYGMAHIVMFDTETDYKNAADGPAGSEHLDAGPFGASDQQIDFLEADLASVDRSVTPWLIVAGHRPWYTTGGGSPCSPCQDAFEDLFYKYGVDLAVFGHVHNSQRFAPIYNGTVDPAGLQNPKAPVYIVAGGAGNIEGLSDVGDNTTGNVFAYADDFSYASVKFLDANHLGVEFFQSSTDALLDSSVLYKAHNASFVTQS